MKSHTVQSISDAHLTHVSDLVSPDFISWAFFKQINKHSFNFTQISSHPQTHGMWMDPAWVCTCHLSGRPSCCTHSCSRTLARSTPRRVSGWTGPRQNSCVVSKSRRHRCQRSLCWECPLRVECAGSLQLPRQRDPERQMESQWATLKSRHTA